MLREVCRLIGYHGRYVWLIPAHSVTMRASQFAGPSRIRYRFIDTHLLPVFEAIYQPILQEEDKTVYLDLNTVCVALPIIRKRRRILLVFMEPERALLQTWSTTTPKRPSPEEIAVLQGRDRAYDHATMAVARAVCEFRGLTYNEWITPKGAKILEYMERRCYLPREPVTTDFKI